MKKFIITIIKAYKRTSGSLWPSGLLVPVSSVCKFHPSCSEYTIESINKHGVTAGLMRGAWRLLRCNPWSKGGVDLA